MALRFEGCRRAAAAVSLIACLGHTTQAAAQQNSISLEAGVIQYDAGGDQTYPLFTLRGGREVRPWLRLVLGLSMASIGEIERSWVIPGGSETLWRFFATGTAVAHRPFQNSGVALLNRISPEGGFGLGVVHSAGIEVDSAVFSNPFFAVEDQPTGLALGISLGLAVEVSQVVSIRLTSWYWSDHLYGDALSDFELTGGVAVNW